MTSALRPGRARADAAQAGALPDSCVVGKESEVARLGDGYEYAIEGSAMRDWKR